MVNKVPVDELSMTRFTAYLNLHLTAIEISCLVIGISNQSSCSRRRETKRVEVAEPDSVCSQLAKVQFVSTCDLGVLGPLTIESWSSVIRDALIC